MINFLFLSSLQREPFQPVLFCCRQHTTVTWLMFNYFNGSDKVSLCRLWRSTAEGGAAVQWVQYHQTSFHCTTSFLWNPVRLLLSSSPKTLTCRQSFLLLSKSSWQCTSNLKLPTLFKGKMWISFSTSWLIFTLQLFSFLPFFLYFVGIAKNVPPAPVMFGASSKQQPL